MSEIIGLQWQDVDLESGVLQLRRGVVNQQVDSSEDGRQQAAIADSSCAGEGTLGLEGARVPTINRSIGCLPALTRMENIPKEHGPYNQPEHWVFPSPHKDGKHPYWAGTLLQKLVQPAARRPGIAKLIGWHSFRRSFATLLYANEVDVRTTQELMRHSTPVVTVGVYAQAVTAEKRLAQSRIAGLILAQGGTKEHRVSACVPFRSHGCSQIGCLEVVSC